MTENVNSPAAFGFSHDEWQCVSDLLSAPTTTYHEENVVEILTEYLEQFGLHWGCDPAGNVIASTQKMTGLSKNKISRRGLKQIFAKAQFVFSAHMDHPGFEVVDVQGTDLTVRFLGAVHRGQFNEARVKVWDGERKKWVKARVVKRNDLGSRESKDYRASTQIPIKTVHVTASRTVPVGSFGCFDHPGCQFKNGIVATKSADNLFNCALSAIVLRDLKRRHPRKNFVAVFTRAEEEGFVGLYALLQTGTPSVKVPWIVLETSKAMNEVKLGKGVVVRVGDAATCFHPDMEVWLRRAATECTSDDKSFVYQRALMQGGTCEATLLNYQGYLVSGLALPLNNYHNVGPRNPAPEHVHLKDAQTLRQLLMKLPELPAPREIVRQNAQKLAARIRENLKRL